MSEPVKKETVIAVVMIALAVIVLVAALLWDGSSSASTAAQPARSEQVDAFDREWESSSGIQGLDQPSPTSAGRAGSASSSASDRERLTAAGFVAEIERILRAGRKLEALRNSKNLTLTRRCLEVSQTLESELGVLRSRGMNIKFPGTDSSLDEVVRLAMLCTSCSADARQFCVMAQTSLNGMGKPQSP